MAWIHYFMSNDLILDDHYRASYADVIQLVECLISNQNVESSSLFIRSNFKGFMMKQEPYFQYKWIPQNKLHWSVQKNIYSKDRVKEYVVVEFWTDGRCFRSYEIPKWNIGPRGLKLLIQRLQQNIKDSVISQYGPNCISDRKLKI